MAVTAEVSFTDRFWPSVYGLGAAETKQVVKAVTQLAQDPTNDTLRLHPVQGDKTGRKYTCRANRDIRILLLKQGDVLLLDRAGHHDDVYDLASRIDLVFNQGTGRIVVTDRDETPHLLPTLVNTKSTKVDPDRRGLFDHWADADLADAGLGPEEVSDIRACATEDDLLALDTDDETLALLIDLLGRTPEQWRNPTTDTEAATTEAIREAITERGTLDGLSPLFSPAELDHLLSGPIEDWMIFLHPDQRRGVERSYEGPARIRGSAGTGKTVVALHRAAALVARFQHQQPDDQATEEGPTTVLFTTYIRSLPPVFERLYHRLPASNRADDIEFCHIDRLAHRICTEAGDRPVVDPRKVDATFAGAAKQVAAQVGLTPSYLRDEITQVIKGRGITSLDAYMALERTGRRTPLGGEQRRQVWALKESCDRALGDAGLRDFPDIVLAARDHARRRPRPMYRAVIVDEAQDLTLVGLQLIRSLVNGPDGRDRPDGLFIVGDGAQRIYAGGFTLRQAGVEVRGRTTVLRTNYRNTSEIIAAAMAVAGDQPVDDLGDQLLRGDAPAEARRNGARPKLVHCQHLDGEGKAIIEEIRHLVADGRADLGDIAVATATNAQADEISKLLNGATIPTINLGKYDGSPVNKVKVGTHFRIKGLEFKAVFLPRLGAAEFPRPPAPGQSVAETAERRALAMSQLFVAMTRARDELWLLATGDPSPVLARSLDSFDLVETSESED